MTTKQEYFRDRARRLKAIYRERLDCVRVARFLHTGELPKDADVCRAFGRTWSKVTYELAGDSIPAEYADYCGVPVESLKSFSSLYKALTINRDINN